jgi:antitoxin component YwqK of YwqJK toxin-antitoxin module
LRPRCLIAIAALLGACDPGYEVCTTHYPDGEVWSVRYFEQGRPERPWVAWWNEGTPRFETYYQAGRRNGTWVTRDVSGRVLFERDYLDDEPHGAWRRFRPDGSPISVAHFEGGRAVGLWRWFAPDGSVEREQDFGPPR